MHDIWPYFGEGVHGEGSDVTVTAQDDCNDICRGFVGVITETVAVVIYVGSAMIYRATLSEDWF